MIIFLYGEDTYRSREKLKELKDKFTREVDPSRLNLESFDGLKITIPDFQRAITTTPFLAKKRMVIFENICQNKKTQSEALEFLQEYDAGDDAVLVFLEEEKINNGLFKFLAKQKYSQEFKPMDDYALGQWIAAEVQKRGGEIKTLAVRTLVEYVGNNLWLLGNEINKLLSYTKGREIEKVDVEELVHTKFDNNIFGLVDALGAKNKKEALKLFSSQLGFGSSAQYIISMLIRQYRILLQVQEHSDEPSDAVAKKTKLHPFVAKKALAQSRKYSFTDLKRIYAELLDIDKKIKSTSLDPELLVDLLIAKV